MIVFPDGNYASIEQKESISLIQIDVNLNCESKVVRSIKVNNNERSRICCLSLTLIALITSRS